MRRGRDGIDDRGFADILLSPQVGEAIDLGGGGPARNRVGNRGDEDGARVLAAWSRQLGAVSPDGCRSDPHPWLSTRLKVF